MNIATIGRDLAKQWFQVHGVDDRGQTVVRRKLRRGEVGAYFRSLSPCLVGMEVCATAHHWARELTALGHEVRLMPPGYVKAYVKRNKNDAADAEAICEAVSRPSMRFVPVKTAEQQAVLMLHRARNLLVRQRTMLRMVVEQLRDTVMRVREIEVRLAKWHRASKLSQLLATIPGIGIMGATAIAATVTDPALFRSGREFAAWLGRTPRQHSSGGKERLGRTSKRGDKYIRCPLVAGAVAVPQHTRNRTTKEAAWVQALLLVGQRQGPLGGGASEQGCPDRLGGDDARRSLSLKRRDRADGIAAAGPYAGVKRT